MTSDLVPADSRRWMSSIRKKCATHKLGWRYVMWTPPPRKAGGTSWGSTITILLQYYSMQQLHGLLQYYSYYSYYSLSVGNERANADGTAEPALRETKFSGANERGPGKYIFSCSADQHEQDYWQRPQYILYIIHACINARLRWYFQHAHFIQLVGVGQGRRT